MKWKRAVDLRFLGPEFTQKMFNIEFIFYWHTAQEMEVCRAGRVDTLTDNPRPYIDLTTGAPMSLTVDQVTNIQSDLTNLLGQTYYVIEFPTYIRVVYDPTPA